MLHLTAYHQSSAVADNRKAPAGKLQFKKERVVLSPRLPTTLSSLLFTSARCDFHTTQQALCFGLLLFFSLSFFSILSSFLVPFDLFPNHPATVTPIEAIAQRLLPHTAYKWFPQGNISINMIWQQRVPHKDRVCKAAKS